MTSYHFVVDILREFKKVAVIAGVIPMLGGEDRLTWKCGFAIVIPQTLSPHPSPPSNMW